MDGRKEGMKERWNEGMNECILEKGYPKGVGLLGKGARGTREFVSGKGSVVHSGGGMKRRKVAAAGRP